MDKEVAAKRPAVDGWGLSRHEDHDRLFNDSRRMWKRKARRERYPVTRLGWREPCHWTAWERQSHSAALRVSAATGNTANLPMTALSKR